MAVAVSCPHRKDAFEAGRFLIDRLKEDVPIWKQETGGRFEGVGASGSPAGVNREFREAELRGSVFPNKIREQGCGVPLIICP